MTKYDRRGAEYNPAVASTAAPALGRRTAAKRKDRLFQILLTLAILLFIAALFFSLFQPLERYWQPLGLLLSAGVLLLIARWRVVRNRALWPAAGCPSCQDNELLRVRRSKKDRMIGLTGIPVGRFECRECHWNGLRINNTPK